MLDEKESFIRKAIGWILRDVGRKRPALADAFIGLPGGWGTMDEIFEVLTWNQIGYHQKPVGLLNVGGYFNKLLDFFDHMVQERFVAPEHRVMMLSGDEPGALVDMLGTLDPPR